ncbi:MAG TPA: OsmC family protein [Candidatus Saccharimonadales bacterium]|nr:OsmC family protein [Candidatus Saccharimonadales bacterium]
MVTIDIQYQGDLRCEAVHQPSGTRLNTDAPKDNFGKGESFSPTDLVATALGTCMLTLMGIAARSLKVDLKGTRVTVQKEMVAAPLRRIGTLAVKIAVPVKLTDEQKLKLEQAALTCPVHKSLHPDVQMPVEFLWA